MEQMSDGGMSNAFFQLTTVTPGQVGMLDTVKSENSPTQYEGQQ